MENQINFNTPHLSARQHVTGEAVYVNDMDFGGSLLTGLVVYSPHAHAKVVKIDYSEAALLDGVEAILTHKDIPGKNQLGPIAYDEPCLAGDEVNFIGQAIALIAARDEETARKAEKLIRIEFEPLTSILDIESAIKANTHLTPQRKIETGSVDETLEAAPNVISGILRTGAQEHWYLETQSAICIPQEAGEMVVHSSTQHPTETQIIVARVLGRRSQHITVEVKRMGGAFGGKETQANHIAAWCALLANATGRPVKIHLFRDDDQIMTGKRHPFLAFYEAAFDDTGKILALDAQLHSDGGASLDLSGAILERAMFHIDNAYYIPHLRVTGQSWKTNFPPNTAFRGFGGPQGMAVIETVIDKIARYLKKDAGEVRKINFYHHNGRNITHYGQIVENIRLDVLYEEINQLSGYSRLRESANDFNTKNEFHKKGLAITPVKFGISFTTSFLNQAGALVHIYADGSVQVNHGGTEMGQGLHTKIQNVAAAELGISHQLITLMATNTSKVPNTSATAASSGSDLNGMAVKNAIQKLKNRLATVAHEMIDRIHRIEIQTDNITFANNKVFDVNHPEKSITFNELVSQAYLSQISLSATGFYKTPGIHYDKEKGKGHPFYYFAFGMAVSEVLLDTLTGYHKITKTYIIHDAGESLNPKIDIGQVEGAFIQGVGWCTTEQIKWNDKGFLLTHSPDTYKIPGVRDIPEEFVVQLLENAANPGTIRRSKAVGEPPFMLAFAVWLAIKDAISAVGNHRFEPEFNLPATNDEILLSIEKITQQSK